ncbi:unnamed protein product [Arctogadus glacialis]
MPPPCPCSVSDTTQHHPPRSEAFTTPSESGLLVQLLGAGSLSTGRGGTQNPAGIQTSNPLLGGGEAPRTLQGLRPATLYWEGGHPEPCRGPDQQPSTGRGGTQNPAGTQTSNPLLGGGAPRTLQGFRPATLYWEGGHPEPCRGSDQQPAGVEELKCWKQFVYW